MRQTLFLVFVGDFTARRSASQRSTCFCNAVRLSA